MIKVSQDLTKSAQITQNIFRKNKLEYKVVKLLSNTRTAVEASAAIDCKV